MKRKISACVIVLSLTVSGCVTDDWGTNQTVGTGVGAVTGGLVGSMVGSGSGRLWAVGAGVLLGALAGSSIGQSLDKADRLAMREARDESLSAPVGEKISWKNPDSGHSGTYIATREGADSKGRQCRQYKQTIMIDNKQQKGYGTACQQADGTWKIVK
ncbi:MAG: glycine zipper 2TM domain-containing protein [Proteobacteria bacterium]|nr:glycine zipper 2TM domain-containing protein [Pseudomonadota bacterium]